jgi:ACS family sodium-dependent inorganic phosphate cotransporter
MIPHAKFALNQGFSSLIKNVSPFKMLIFHSFYLQAYSSPLDDPQLRPAEKKLIFANSFSKEPVESIPWRLILSKAPVWALIVSHFCHNWGTFILLTWMPTYYNQVSLFFHHEIE